MNNVDVKRSGAEYKKVDGNADEMVRECVDLARMRVKKKGWMHWRVRKLMSVR